MSSLGGAEDDLDTRNAPCGDQMGTHGERLDAKEALRSLCALPIKGFGDVLEAEWTPKWDAIASRKRHQTDFGSLMILCNPPTVFEGFCVGNGMKTFTGEHSFGHAFALLIRDEI